MRQLKIHNKITSRESIAFEKYLTDISHIELLSIEEEGELAARIREGDNEALEKLTKANLRFVVSVAKQYQNQGLSLPDLVNEGNVGLIKAARRFDETRGFKFISYAVWWIRQSIISAIIEYSRIVRMPVNKLTIYRKVNEAWMDFVQKNEREPTNEELSAILDIPAENIGHVLKGRERHLSIDAPLSDDPNAMTLIDLLSIDEENSPDLKLMKESVQKEVLLGLDVLSPREAEIITRFYGLGGERPWSIEEIAHNFGLSKERTRQIRDRAIRRLRKSMTKESLLSFLD